MKILFYVDKGSKIKNNKKCSNIRVKEPRIR